VGNYPYGPETAQRLDVITRTPPAAEGRSFFHGADVHGGGWIHSYTNNAVVGQRSHDDLLRPFLAHGFHGLRRRLWVADVTVDGALAPRGARCAARRQVVLGHMDYFMAIRTR